jgi:mRNA deadenylase 3'-5' endonuclease subunit Ccr4
MQAFEHGTNLYPDIHPEHLDWFKHRGPLALKEIRHWAPDVICAQEVSV